MALTKVYDKDDAAPESALEVASRRHDEIRTRLAIARERYQNAKMAIGEIDAGGNAHGDLRSPGARDGFYDGVDAILTEFRGSRRKLAAIVDDLVEEIELLTQQLPDAIRGLEEATQAEVDRIAATLAPRHRKAVEKIKDALHALDAAVADEVAIHRDLRSALPESIGRFDSSRLPDLHSALMTMRLSVPESRAAHWLAWCQSAGLLK